MGGNGMVHVFLYGKLIVMSNIKIIVKEDCMSTRAVKSITWLKFCSKPWKVTSCIWQDISSCLPLELVPKLCLENLPASSWRIWSIGQLCPSREPWCSWLTKSSWLLAGTADESTSSYSSVALMRGACESAMELEELLLGWLSGILFYVFCLVGPVDSGVCKVWPGLPHKEFSRPAKTFQVESTEVTLVW